jgi:hypothetical protein
MYAQGLCGFGIVLAGLFNGSPDDQFLGFANRVVSGLRLISGRRFLGHPIRRSSGRMTSLDPSTTARSMAFSSSRTLPGQS